MKQWQANEDETFAAMNMVADYSDLLLRMCHCAKEALAQDPIVVDMKSPVYVMGDLHGSFRDLHFYVQHLLNFGHFEYTPCKLLFLGDYVDRGEASLEVCINPQAEYRTAGAWLTAQRVIEGGSAWASAVVEEG